MVDPKVQVLIIFSKQITYLEIQKSASFGNLLKHATSTMQANMSHI